MPKATTPTAERQGRRHNPLENDILATGPLRLKPPKVKKAAERDSQEYVDAKQSKKILRMARELAEEEEAASGVAGSKRGYDSFGFDSREAYRDQEVEVEEVEDGSEWGDDDQEPETEEVAPEDLDVFNRFLPPPGDDPLLRHGWGGKKDGQAEESAPGINIADLILQKIAEHEAAQERAQMKEKGIAPPDEEEGELSEKVVEAFTQIGDFLSRYKSGPLPKPFKVLPTIPRWEEILSLTNPDQWTPNACYQATRIFVSGKNAVAERFLNMVILDRVREDIRETKRLNPHLFNALKKGLYKPLAWVKGFLIPLAASGTLTLREATIVSAVLARVSIPVVYSAAALWGLCDVAAERASQGTEGGGAINILIRTLLDKRYALPYRVIDELVFHFLRFRSVDPAAVSREEALKLGPRSEAAAAMKAKLPVIWHQCLLSFAQRYRNEITEDQREALLDLLLTHGHAVIGPEVRKELLAGRGRGVPVEPPKEQWDGDDTMVIDG